MSNGLNEFMRAGWSYPLKIDRTHYEEKQWVCLLPEQTINVVSNGSSGVYTRLTAEQTLDLVVGETYTVIYDGTEYNLECANNVYWQSPCLGSNDSYDSCYGTTFNQDIPFCYTAGIYGTAPGLLSGSRGNHTIEIWGNKTVVKTIDEKFLPPAAKRMLVNFTITDLETEAVVSDKTFAEIEAAIASGYWLQAVLTVPEQPTYYLALFAHHPDVVVAFGAYSMDSAVSLSMMKDGTVTLA